MTLATRPQHHIPAADSQTIPFEGDAAKGGELGIRVSGNGPITKDNSDHHDTFAMFAFVSAMLVPNALKLFRSFLRHQEFHKRFSDKAGRMEDESAREKVKEAQLNQRLNRLCQVAEDTWWLPNATANSISTKGPVFRSPNWTGEPRPSGAETLRWTTDEFEQPTIKLLRDCGFRYAWLQLQPFSLDVVSDFEEEQRALALKRLRERRLLRALNDSKSRMSTAMAGGVFDVFINGTKIAQAASARGLKPRSLSMAIWRISDRLRNPAEIR
jgi:hypothetical protein